MWETIKPMQVYGTCYFEYIESKDPIIAKTIEKIFKEDFFYLPFEVVHAQQVKDESGVLIIFKERAGYTADEWTPFSLNRVLHRIMHYVTKTNLVIVGYIHVSLLGCGRFSGIVSDIDHHGELWLKEISVN